MRPNLPPTTILTGEALIVRSGPIFFFANSDRVSSIIRRRLDDAGSIRTVIFDAEHLEHIDSTALVDLCGLRRDLAERGVGFKIARAPRWAQDAIRRTCADAEIQLLFDDPVPVA